MSKLRIGFLSTANIGRQNWKAVFNSGSCVISAVASRDPEKSRKFINGCQAEFPFETPPTPFGSYEELLASKNVDAVYVPLPTGLRKEWVLRAAAAGKHVICEKPCGISFADVQEMTDACRKNRVQFMDGVMFMHNPRLLRVRKVLDDKKSVGSIRRISSAFSFCGNDEFSRGNIRLDGRLEPAGCLGDLGWYCLRFALWTMKWQLPREVIGRTLSARSDRQGPASGPLEFSGELFFANGVSAGFYSSFTAKNQRWVNVTGVKGSLRMDDFIHPFNPSALAYQLNDTMVPVPVAKLTDQTGRELIQTQEVNMFRHFARQIRSGQLNEEWPLWSWRTQLVQDACLESARLGGWPVKVAG